VFSVILLVVIFTTLATPPVLTHILRKMARENTLAPPTALPERELVTH
jgi:hypothetical protein